MRVAPRWQVAVGVYLAYNAIIFATWAAVGANYMDLISEKLAFGSLVLPLGLGMIFLAGTVTYLGWWRETIQEEQPGTPRWSFGWCSRRWLASSWSMCRALTGTRFPICICSGSC